VTRSGMSAAEETKRSERVFHEYATLHTEVREWTERTAWAA